MADDVQVYDIAVPASTSSAAPLEVPTVSSSSMSVVRVWIIIPDGHSGLTGIALAFGHQPVIPSNPGAYISGNDEEFPIPMRGYPLGVPWSVFVVNNDIQAHSFETRWELELPSTTVGARPPNAIAPSDVYAAGSAQSVAL